MRSMRSGWLGLGVFVTGCWGVAEEGPGALPPVATAATVSPSFAVATPRMTPDLRIEPRGEGVTLSWPSSPVTQLPVTTFGLGAVTRAATDPVGSVALAHAGGVEERWQTTAAGAEQSWRYARRPDDGRVAVAVSIGGASLDHADAEALWLRAPGGSIVRYSHATWVDADGVRTAVPARWAGDHVAIEVPDEVVARTRFPAVLDPTVSAAIPLSPSQPDAETGVLAMGTMRLAQTDTSNLLFSVTRVRNTGLGALTVQAFDPSGVPTPRSFRGVPATGLISFLDGVDQEYVTASYGSGAMVVATTWLNGLVAARLQPSGVSTDRSPIVLRPDNSPPISIYRTLKLACTNATCLAVYQPHTVPADPNAAVSAQRVSTDGRLLDAAPLALGSNAIPAGAPVVALADRFIVVWTNQAAGSPTNVVAARVMADGRLLDLGGRSITVAGAARSSPRVATDGTRVFMSWYATASGSRLTGWYTQLFDADLNPLSTLAYHPDLNAADPRMDLWWDGTNYVQSGLTPSLTRRQVVRFDATGARLDATPRTLDAVSGPTIVPGRGGVFSLGTTVARYDSVGTPVGSPWPVVQGYSAPEGAAVDSDGSAFVASWYQFRPAVGRPPTQSFVRLGSSGTILDVPPVTLPLAANTARGFALFHEGTRAQTFRLLGPTDRYERSAIDLAARTSGASVSVGSSAGTIIRGGTQRLLLSGGCARRFDAAWTFLDPAPVCFATSPIGSAAAFDGTNFTFVYRLGDQFSSAPLFLRRMNRDGDVLDTPARDLSALGNVSSFNLAYGGGTYLLAWNENSVQRVARIAPDGTAGAPISLGSWAPDSLPIPRPLTPGVVFDGANFVVAWPGYPDTSLRAVRVSPAGVVLDATPFTIVAGGASQPLIAPAVTMASDGRGSTLFVYSAFDTDLAGEQVRAVYFREDGVVTADAGAPPVDAGAAPDVPRDVGVVPVDVGVDAGTPVTDLGVVTDAGGMTDAGVVTDLGAVEDAPIGVDVIDVPTRPDAGGGVPDAAADRPVVADLGVVDSGATDASTTDVPVGGTPPDDGGSLCDVGGTPGRSTHGGFVALAALAMVGVRRRVRRR
ncbi:MAG: hypothetical protein JWM10_4605 [Myxococcaceae bacterium]|nr:hypothetical protein [Myxococcaceae bacterium]